MARRREKGTGNLFIRGNTWYARWRDERGVLRKETTGCSKSEKDKALDFLEEKIKIVRLKNRRDQIALLLRELQDTDHTLADLLATSAPSEPEVHAPTDTVEAADKSPLIADMWGMYLESPRRKDSSADMLDAHASRVRAFEKWAGSDRRASYVTDDVADSYSAQLAKKFSANTYNKHLNTLTAVWKVVCRGLANPWKDIPRKELRTHVRKPFTDAEFDRMAAATDGELNALLHIGRFTALRLGDAAGFKWSYISDGIVRVKRTHKTGAPVSMPLHPRLAEALGKIPRRGEYALPNLHAKYMRDSAAVCRMVGDVIEACGMKRSSVVEVGKRRRPDYGFHSLRHTFVTRYIEGGLPADVVRQFVGHSTAMMTEHYTHLGDQAIVDAFNRIGAGQDPSQAKKSSASDGSKPSIPPSRST